MSDLQVEYLGLKLDNPIIVSSSSLSGTIEGVKRCAEQGPGAIVLKSLFQEQIEHELASEEDDENMTIHPEAVDYIQQMGMQLGPDRYLDLIKKAKGETDIPIIASVNCVSRKWWSNYARQIEDAGADALELNIAIMPRGGAHSAEDIEQEYVTIVDRVAESTELPLAVKIGPYFTALQSFAEQLRRVGAKALVLFNRFYQIDIDTKNLKLMSAYQFSTPEEIYLPLRWISILHGQVECNLVGSTGVHSGEEAVKLLLAGATAVTVCSTLFTDGLNQISKIKSSIADWMKQQEFTRISDFQAKLSQAQSRDPEAYERLQYIRALTGIS